jgi:hypothetical protein
VSRRVTSNNFIFQFNFPVDLSKYREFYHPSYHAHIAGLTVGSKIECGVAAIATSSVRLPGELWARRFEIQSAGARRQSADFGRIVIVEVCRI